MQIRCLIVDDEAPARDELRFLLSRHNDVEIVGEADSASGAVAACHARLPDLVFLDIQMPGKNGFDVIRTLVSELRVPPLFVFVTAYDSYAVDAFEASAVDYILKPVAEARLATTIERARRHLSEKATSLQQLESLLSQVNQTATPKPPARHTKISVEKNGRIRLMDPEKIIFCSYEDNRVMAHTFDEAVPVHGIGCMDRMESHLADTAFFRAHRATLVNLDAIQEFSPWFNGKYALVMADRNHSELTVSRSRVRDFKQRLGL